MRIIHFLNLFTLLSLVALSQGEIQKTPPVANPYQLSLDYQVGASSLYNILGGKMSFGKAFFKVNLGIHQLRENLLHKTKMVGSAGFSGKNAISEFGFISYQLDFLYNKEDFFGVQILSGFGIRFPSNSKPSFLPSRVQTLVGLTSRKQDLYSVPTVLLNYGFDFDLQ